MRATPALWPLGICPIFPADHALHCRAWRTLMRHNTRDTTLIPTVNMAKNHLPPRTSILSAAAPWLFGAKVSVPLHVDAYFSRPRLFSDLARSRIVVIQAPGGFGKTTMLAEMHRQAHARGALSAWLTLDEDDTEEGIGTYLAYAFERAGLRISNPSDALDHGLALVATGIEAHDGPCLLCLDDAERITDGAVTAVNSFLHHLPEKLRIAVGMRENPGLDLGVLDGRDVVLTADQLRFTRQETIDFFAGKLSRRELAEVTARTEGWPVALRIYRNARLNEAGTPVAGAMTAADLAGDDEITANWLGARLLRNATRAERRFLMDIALFDLIDIALVDQVLDRKDTALRMAQLVSLQGLIHSIAGDADMLRLHPLVKDYCAARLRREDPDRYRWLHRKIAVAMEGRGHLLPSIRHAGAAGDSRLVADILDRVGGLRLYLQEGSTRLAGVDGYLTPEVLEGRPRLALLRCRILTNKARLAEAHNLYERVKAQTQGFTADPTADSARALRVDATVIAATLVGYGCMPVTDELIRDVRGGLDLLEQEDAPDAATLAVHNLILCIAYYQRARFDIARGFAAEARKQYERCTSPLGDLVVSSYDGLLEMAQGRGGKARDHYEHARRVAANYFPNDSSRALVLDILSTELGVEHKLTQALASNLPEAPMILRDVGVLLDVRVAAHELTAEWTYEMGGAEQALRVVEESWASALSEGLVGAVRHLSALRIVYLIADGRVDQATRAWSGAGLPENLPDLLDLEAQSWREMEAISCARIRLLTALGKFEAAREVAKGLAELARKRRLARTRMRCLALWMVLEYRAQRDQDASARLLEYLRAYRDTDYIRPLVREGETGALLLRSLLESDLPAGMRETASAALEQLGSKVADTSRTQPYTDREIEVLEGLARAERNKEIARRLGISEHGVRYHLKNLYRKLGATGRVEAVKRARSAGVMDPCATRVR